MKRLLTMFIAASGLLAACNDSGGDLNRTPIFKVVSPNGTDSSQTIEIDGKPQTVEFTVMATDDWSAMLSQTDGFTLSVSSGGTGSTPVTLSAKSNTSGAVRSTQLSFYFRGESEARYLYTITQAEEQPYIDVTPTSVPLIGDATEFTIAVTTNQTSWSCDFVGEHDWLTQTSKTAADVTFSVTENHTGSIREVQIKIFSELHPEVFTYVDVQQGYLVDPPTADLLDVVFGENGAAEDVSPLKMPVELRPNEFVTTTYLEKYGRYAAVFTHEPGLSKLTGGYYTIPYYENETFKSKMEDGYTMEMLVRRYDDPKKLQIKPFAASEAGGVSLCFWADDSNQIVMETGTLSSTGGNTWRQCKSGVTPQKDVYYHVVGVWDKEAGTQKIYVNGELKATNDNAGGEFKHMNTNVNKRWFGIGADPGADDTGQISFKGEVVIARVYGDPLTAEQVYALWKLVK